MLYVERFKGKGTIIFCFTSILDSDTRKAMFKPTVKLSKIKLEKK